MYTCIHIYIHIYIYICIYMYVYMSIYMLQHATPQWRHFEDQSSGCDTHIYIYIYTYTYMYPSLSLSICINIHIYTCIYICIYIYTYIYATTRHGPIATIQRSIVRSLFEKSLTKIGLYGKKSYSNELVWKKAL